MCIKVLNENQTIFKGEADDFLFIQNNDSELEFFLNKLELMEYDKYFKFTNYNNEEFIIKKIVDK